MSPQKRTAMRAKLQRQLEEIRRLKNISAEAERDWRELQTATLENLDELDLNSFSYENAEGERVKATKIEASSLVFDQPQLKKALGAKVWNKVTTRILDTTKLEDQIAEGRIDPVTVAECSTEKFNKPYIKVTARAATKDQSTDSSDSPRVGRHRGIPTS